MKQLYLTPFMTVFCVPEDVLTASDESPFHYNDGAGDGGSVPFAG